MQEVQSQQSIQCESKEGFGRVRLLVVVGAHEAHGRVHFLLVAVLHTRRARSWRAVVVVDERLHVLHVRRRRAWLLDRLEIRLSGGQ